jgi:hypothetical protein
MTMQAEIDHHYKLNADYTTPGYVRHLYGMATIRFIRFDQLDTC